RFTTASDEATSPTATDRASAVTAQTAQAPATRNAAQAPTGPASALPALAATPGLVPPKADRDKPALADGRGISVLATTNLLQVRRIQARLGSGPTNELPLEAVRAGRER